MANAPRRQALWPLHEVFAGRDQRRLRLLDVGCGTGRALDFFKQAWPRLPALGLDMSEAYVAEAKRHLKQWCWVDFVVANGEAIPLADQSQDAVTSIFMFHELPPKGRRMVFRELARVLRRRGDFHRGELIATVVAGGNLPTVGLHPFAHRAPLVGTTITIRIALPRAVGVVAGLGGVVAGLGRRDHGLGECRDCDEGGQSQ